MFRYCIWRVDGNTGDRDPKTTGCGEIHIVETSAAQGKQLSALGGKLLQAFPVHGIVDEHADSSIATGSSSGFGTQTKGQKS